MALFKQYDDFLLNNASQITAVESSLRSITYFLPGRFKDAELAGEAIYSALNLLGLYHDSILVRALEKQNGRSQRDLEASAPASRKIGGPLANPLTSSEHTRYTQHFSQQSTAYSHIAKTLVMIGYVELLVEMMARRKLGNKKAWDVVAGIEAVKVALRLSLVHLTGNRSSVQPPIPEREVDPAALESERTKTMSDLAENIDNATRQSPDGAPPKGFWKGARTGFLRPTLASLRPGFDDPLLDQTDSAPEPESRLPHLRALQINAAHSGSDSDDTLVDSSRLNASTSLSQINGNSSAVTQKKALASPPLNMKPWTETQINDYLLSRVLSVNDVRKPEDLVRPLRDGLGKTAEALWILRPLIYVLAIRRWGRKATLPFALSFVLEYLAKDLRQRSLQTGSASDAKNLFATNPLMAAMMGSNPMTSILASILMGGSGGDKAKRPVSSVEETEWSKRNNSFWWYLLRGPVWHSYTRPKVSALIQRTQGKFLLGVVGGVLSDYLPLVDEYYYYSAT